MTSLAPEAAADDRLRLVLGLTSRLLDVPVAMVNEIGAAVRTRAAYGLAATVVPADQAFCPHVGAESYLEIPDLAGDPRFASNPFVTGGQRMRFYAGQAIAPGSVDADRATLCVLDRRQRRLTPDQRVMFAALASWAEAELGGQLPTDPVDAAEAREAYLRNVLVASPEALLRVDVEGRVVLVNAMSRYLFGSPDHQDRHVAVLFPDLAAGATPFDERPEGTDPVSRVTTEARDAGGRGFPVELSTAELPGPDGLRWLVLLRDLRPSVEIQEQLRRQERLTRLVLESAWDGIVGSDSDGHVLFANPAALRILGCTEQDLVGRSLHDVAHHSREDGSPYPVEQCPTHHAIAAGTSVEPHEDLFWRHDGSPVPVEMSVAPMVVDGQVQGAVTTFRDVSERREVDRLKSEFVGVVSHELRTPLTSIRGALDLLDAGIAGPVAPEQESLLRMAVQNAHRLSDLVNDILDIDRLDAGRFPLHPEPVDATYLARTVVDDLAAAAASRGVALALDVVGPALVEVDPSRMRQAFTNLVGNAVKYTPAGGDVQVVVRAGEQVRLEVHDTGPGIAEHDLGVIFERFRQADSVDASARKGTGLGLAITREIVERSGGRIEVVSELGTGSVFTVLLPPRADPSAPDPDEES